MLFLLSWPLLIVLWLISLVIPGSLLGSLLGYLYPAYATYKTVERRSSEPDDFRFWCKYWVIMAAFHVLESCLFFGLITWLPFYDVFKVLFCVYLWHPRTQGTLLIYHRAIVPALSRHEQEIDRRIAEVQTRGMDLAVEYSRILASKIMSLAKAGAEAAPKVYERYQQHAAAQPAASTASTSSYSSGELGEKITGLGDPVDYDTGIRARKPTSATGMD